MRKQDKILRKFKKLFPEECYIMGLERDFEFIEEEAGSGFLNLFEKHLNFYEKNYLTNHFEKLNKIGLLLSYHLYKREPLSGQECKFIEHWLDSISCSDLYLNGEMAFDFLEKASNSFLRSDIDSKGADMIRRKIYPLCKKVGPKNKVFRPIDFLCWQENIYGILPLPIKKINKELSRLSYRLEKFPEPKERQPDKETLFLEELVSVLKDFSDEEMEVKVTETPCYLGNIFPCAAALSFNRLVRPEGIFYFKRKLTLTPSQLILIAGHEVLGHILHFKLVHKYCRSKIKLFPYFLRFPLTEGFALLAEEFVLRKFREEPENLVRFLERFNLNPGETLKGLDYYFLRYRLLRYLRALFEYEVYLEKKDPLLVVKTLSREYSFEYHPLKQDLFSFLATPGYGSSYIKGYNFLAKRGVFDDADFRKRIGEQGLTGLDLLEL